MLNDFPTDPIGQEMNRMLEYVRANRQMVTDAVKMSPLKFRNVMAGEGVEMTPEEAEDYHEILSMTLQAINLEDELS